MPTFKGSVSKRRGGDKTEEFWICAILVLFVGILGVVYYQ